MSRTAYDPRDINKYLCDDSKIVLVLGDEGIGKTSLIKSYLGQPHNNCFEHSIFTAYPLEVLCPTSDVQCMAILDIPSGVSDDARREAYKCVHVDVVIMCFAVDDSTSLDNARKKWYEEVLADMGVGVQIILAGLRCDLRTDKEERGTKNRSSVSLHDATKVKEALHLKSYAECCISDGPSVAKVFKTAISPLYHFDSVIPFCDCN